MEGLVDLLGPSLQVSFAPRGTEHSTDPWHREPSSELWGRRTSEHGARLRGSQVGEGVKRSRVELPKRVSKGVHLALSGPDEALVSPREHLDGLGHLGVPGHLSVVVPVGAHEVGEDPGVPGIGLRSGGCVALPVAGGREGVHRVHPVASRHERPHHEASVQLDADHDGGRFLGVVGHHLVQSPDALYAVGNSRFSQDPSLVINHADVVVGLRPIDPHEDHRFLLPLDWGPRLARRRLAAR